MAPALACCIPHRRWMATLSRKTASPTRARKTADMDPVKFDAPRRRYQAIPFRLDQSEDPVLVPQRDFADMFLRREDPRNFHRRNLPASRCTGVAGNRASRCNFVVSDDHIVTALDPPMHCEPIRDKRQSSNSAARLDQ